MGLACTISCSSKCLEKFRLSPVCAFRVGYKALCGDVLTGQQRSGGQDKSLGAGDVWGLNTACQHQQVEHELPRSAKLKETST